MASATVTVSCAAIVASEMKLLVFVLFLVCSVNFNENVLVESRALQARKATTSRTPGLELAGVFDKNVLQRSDPKINEDSLLLGSVERGRVIEDDARFTPQSSGFRQEQTSSAVRQNHPAVSGPYMEEAVSSASTKTVEARGRQTIVIGTHTARDDKQALRDRL